MKRAIEKIALSAVPLVLAAVLTVAPNGASAFDPTRDDYSPDDMPGTYFALKQMKPMDVMHQMDANKDGMVSKAEFMKYMGALYDRMDRKHDDKVTAEEWLKNVWMSP
jgi:hypothetical protein